MDTYLRTDRATKKGTFKSKETIYIKQTGTNIVNNSQPASSDIYIINNINIYLNNTIYTRLGRIIKPSYQKGLRWFNSKKDENHSSMLKTESRLQYDLIKFYAYYNTRLNLPLFTKTQVIDPETNQPVMVKKEIKNKKIKENKEIKNGKAPLCPSDVCSSLRSFRTSLNDRLPIVSKLPSVQLCASP